MASRPVHTDDSASYRDRFALNPAGLTDLVQQAYVNMQGHPEGFLQSILKVILLS